MSKPLAQASSSGSLQSVAPFSSTSQARLQALYSDFSRHKQSNTTSWNANIDWWRNALQTIVANGLQKGHQDTRLVLHASQGLMDALKIPGVGKPAALGAIVSELHSAHALFPLSEFLSSKRPSIYDPGWLPKRIAAYLVGRPLWWTLEQLGIVGEEGIVGGGSSRNASWQGSYVAIALVEEAAADILDKHHEKMSSPGDALYTRSEFSKTFGPSETESLGDTDAKVLIQFLVVDKRVAVVDGDIIKFVDESATDEERTVTAADRGIVELRAAVNNLHAQVDDIQGRMADCTKRAAAALQQKQKSVAVSHLQSRKRLDGLLQERLGSLNTLEATYISVESALGNVEIMKSFQSSSVTLKTILSHPLLQRDNIDDTLEALAEANADAQEISGAINVGADIATGIEFDESELEAELADLVQDVNREEKERLREEDERALRAKLSGAGAAPQKEPVRADKEEPQRVHAV